MKTEFDILIIGGGLAGGSLALALSASPYSIGLVEAVSDDQRRASPTGERALAIANGTKQLLDGLGVWSKASQDAMPIKKIHISDRGHFGKTRLSAQDQGVAALGYVITARSLEDSISEALNHVAVERICPARLVGLKSASDAACISLRQGEESLNLGARLVVGADGGESTVRRLLNILPKIRDYHQSAIITTVKPEIDPQFTAYERFTPAGPLAFLPTKDGCCSVIWTKTSEQADSTMSLSERDFLNELQSAFGYWLGRLAARAPHRAFPLKLVQASAMASGRVVLVGNAVHQLHPVAGQGLNLGLRDVAYLAEMLVMQGEAAKDPGAQVLLDRYTKTRKIDHERVIRFTDSLINVFSNSWKPIALARNFGLLTLDCVPPAKRGFARYAMGIAGRTPRLSPP